MQDDRIWYKCDPEKNTTCKKRSCAHNPDSMFGDCTLTSDPAYSVDGVKYRTVAKKNGAAIIFVTEPIE